MTLTLILLVLGMNALVPVGYMIAPSDDQLFIVTPCPSTNPLARAVHLKTAEHAKAAGHEKSADHVTTGGHVTTDNMLAMSHAEMGHLPSGTDDGQPSSAQPKADCAFSTLTFDAINPGKLSLGAVLLAPLAPDTASFADFGVIDKSRLRPPERAPPVRA